MKRLISFILAVAAIVAPLNASQRRLKLDRTALEANIDKSQKARLATSEIVGSQVIVCQGDKVILNKCYGTKGVGLDDLKGDEMYRVASMTKPVTGLALLIEQERGHLDIFDNVEDYLPEFSGMSLKDGPPAAGKVKVYQLVTHSSGIGEVRIRGDRFNLDSALVYLASKPLEYEPGTDNRYSTGAYDVAARIIEKVSGMEFGEYLKVNIFDKLGMDDSTFEPDGEQWDRMVAVFSKTKDGAPTNQPATRKHVFANYPAGYHAAGAGLAMTAEDYLKFARMLACGGKLPGHRRVIGKKTLRQFSQPFVGTSAVKWGMGVRVIDYDGDTLPKGAYGWSGYYGSHFWIDPVNGIIAIYMRNQDFAGGAGAEAANELEKDVMAALR